MMFRNSVSLILIVLLIQADRSKNDYCAELAIKSMVIVPSCPTSKEMWELAASKKHCEKHALRQNCTQANNFRYHCVINEYGNATLEVCAPQRIILGYCTEFNVAGGVIQSHRSVPCNQSTFPKCDHLYFSSKAYRYPACYQLVYNQRSDNATSVFVSLDNATSGFVSLDHTTSSRVNVLITSAYIAFFTAIICGLASFISWKKHQSSKNYKPTLSTDYELTSGTYPDCHEEENENSLSHEGYEENNQKRHPLSREIKLSNPVLFPHEMNSVDKHIFEEDEDNSFSHTGIVGNNQKHQSSKKYIPTLPIYYGFTAGTLPFLLEEENENSLSHEGYEENNQKHQSSKKYKPTLPIYYELTAGTYPDCHEEENENSLSHEGYEENNQKRHPLSREIKLSNPVRFPHEMNLVDKHIFEEDEDNSFSHTGIVGNNQKRNILNTRDTKTQTTTDRLGCAMYKTEEDFREENKEESYRYLGYFRIFDKYFVETHAYIEAEKTFSKYGIVIFAGPPGCGKTIAAIHMIRKIIHEKNWTFRKLQHWEELRHLSMNEKSLIFIDNICCNPKTDNGIESWCEMLKIVNDRYHAVDSYYTGSYRLCIIMTVRSKLIASASGYTDKDMHILNREFCVDTSRLTELEKYKILEKQNAFASTGNNSVLPFSFFDASFRKNVILSEGPVGFPLCAHLYVCGEEFRRSGVQFFSRPIEYLKPLIKEEIEHDKSNKTKSLLLILFFRKWYSIKEGFYMLSIKSESICKQFLNKISRDLIPTFDPLDFRELEFAAQRLLNILVKGVGENTYDFVHDSVYEAVGAYFCETYVTETAMYFPLDIIQHQAYENLTSEQTVTLVTRLMYEALDKRLSEVFSCKIFQSTLFCEQFILQLKKKDMNIIEHLMSVENKSSKANLPCMFWTCLNNLTSLTELFYVIVNERNISPCYNLYVSLFGICCYRYSGGMPMTFDMHLRDIRERVLMFRDDEDNSVINILISSTFSDKFVAIAIEQLLNDGISVERGNKHGASPLMIAVQQKLPRIQVIKILVERSPVFHLRDTTGSTVFHHCLGSAHDDKTCAEILDIIIGSCNDKNLLRRVNLEGDTALSIAAKYSKHSRIQSILLLLEGCRDIVNCLNDDGLTPLHLAVRSFNNFSPCVELECCIRVVILILRGANTDFKSDAGVKTINECQYKCIRNILHHPEDQQIMKIELGCVLFKLKYHEQMSMRSLNCLGKISEGLQGCITEAISYLQNMSFENVSSQYGLDLLT